MRRTHGMSKTKEYRAWVAMKDRCYNKNSKKYPRYGGRGITVCEEYRYSFENWYKDIGAAPDKKLSQDRIDNDLGYNKGNIRWATDFTQRHNQGERVNKTSHGTLRMYGFYKCRCDLCKEAKRSSR